MSTGISSPKRFVLTVGGDLVNVDYVVRVYVETGTGKVFADMQSGPDVQLAISLGQMADMRRLLGINAAPV